MNEEAVIRYINDNFADITTQTVTGNTFFFYDPEQKFPFVTLVTNDEYDQISNLNHPEAYRLNIGVSKQTYQALFASRHFPSSEADSLNKEYDFTTQDKIMPHPVYGRQYWVCILNPEQVTFHKIVEPLLTEAYNMAVSKYSKSGKR